tara:strand:+ start:268 stop:795 length:528 start_codon:yes stop_codon:yes gene_type:complete
MEFISKRMHKYNYIMKYVLLFIFLNLFLSSVNGQTEFKKKNSIYLELAGSGGFGSLNFEQSFFKKNMTELTWRAGLSFAPIDKNNGTGIVFPIMINTLFGTSSHKAELGLGQGITITTRGSAFALTTAVAGYRYAPANKNWFYRVSYTPLISYLVDVQIQHWGGISIGYTFKNKS